MKRFIFTVAAVLCGVLAGGVALIAVGVLLNGFSVAVAALYLLMAFGLAANSVQFFKKRPPAAPPPRGFDVVPLPPAGGRDESG